MNKNSDIDSSFYLVVTQNPKNPSIRNIIEEHWPLLNKSNTTCTLQDSNLIFGLRHDKNLSDYIVRVLNKILHEKLANTQRNPCLRQKKCRYCLIINKTGQIKSYSNKKIFTSMIMIEVNCQSSNIIYYTYKTCGIQKKTLIN